MMDVQQWQNAIDAKNTKFLVASHKGNAKFCWAVDVDTWL
jgi:hypothetical protein